jgi:uncharacterized integral membrane protein
MIRRIVTILIVIPLAIVLIALAVANRESVPLRLDVFNPQNPALTINAPFFVWLFAAIAIGVVAGGVGAWFAQGKHRKMERKYKREAKKLRYEVNDRQGDAKSSGKNLALARPAN